MSATAAARSVLRPSFAVRHTAATRLAAGIKPKPASFSPLRVPKQQRPLSLRISRSPVELSCCVETLLPYHTATASALLNSMLSVSRHTYGWILDDCNDDV